MNLLENMDHELWESKNVIYCYTNKINGKRYVGQTIQKLRKRHGQHLSGKQLIDKKLKQYGVENFKLEVLHLADMYSIDMLERHYIYFFDTFVKNGKGYNVSSGGHNGSPWAGKTEEELEEWKVKYGTPIVGVGIDSILSYKYIEEAKKDGFNPKGISTTCTYHHNPEVFLGKYKHRYVSHKGYKWYYKEDYDRLSEEKKSRTLLKNIVAISTKSEEVLFFENISQISNSGFNINCVYTCCRGESKTHKGYKWYYKEDYDKLTEEEIKAITKKEPKKIVAISTKDGKVLFFENSSQAIKEGFYSGDIHKCCRGESKTHKGYKWYYKEDYDKLTEEEIKAITKKEPKKIKTITKREVKEIVAISTKDEEVLFFENISQATKKIFDSGAIHRCCRGELNKHKGYKWYYKEDYDKLTEEEIKLEISLISNMKTSTPRGVVGVFLKDSNKKIFYTSITQTTKDGFDKSSISKCCRGESKTHKGYKWYYKEDYDKLTEEEIKLEISLISNMKTRIPRGVVGVSLEDSNKKLFYDFISQATKDGFNDSAICRCCKNKLKMYKGYRWYYKEDYDKMIAETD